MKMVARLVSSTYSLSAAPVSHTDKEILAGWEKEIAQALLMDKFRTFIENP
jgi:hypothetical protein